MYVPMKVVVVGDGAVGKTSMLLCYTTNTFPTDYVRTAPLERRVRPPRRVSRRAIPHPSPVPARDSRLVRALTFPFPSPQMATVFDNYAVNVPYGDKTINLGLWDTAGQDEYAQFRPLSYDQADGFILAFSLVDRASFDNVASAWIRELRAKAPDAPIVLVGTKMDLRRDAGERESAKRPSAAAAGSASKTNPSKSASSCVSTEMGEKMREKIGAAAYVECSALTQDNLKKVFETAIDVNMRAGKKRNGGDADGAGKSSKGGCCVVS